MIKWTTIKAIISLVAQKNWKLYHTDIKTTFLHEDLKEEMYITQL